jgi:hypothetical protein
VVAGLIPLLWAALSLTTEALGRVVFRVGAQLSVTTRRKKVFSTFYGRVRGALLAWLDMG